jgi:hypothetical protein
MKEYLLNFVYLLFLLGAFNWYKKLILSQHHIEYYHYGVALIEALVLAKVIMIGDLLHIGRLVKGRPLIIPTLYRAVTFTIWLGLFKCVEHVVGGLIKGRGFVEIVQELLSYSPFQVLALSLVAIGALVPFFAFKELGKTLGEGKVIDLFLRRK